MGNAQEWLDKNYPKNRREKTTRLDISSKNLKGNLDLSDFINLEILICENNKLTNLTLSQESSNLKVLWLSNNKLYQDLTFLKGATNLEHLYLRNNKFHGSLESLKKMKKLKELDIMDTDIDSGLEYLPENIEMFKCSADKRPNAKCQAICDLFASEYRTVGENFLRKLRDYKQWRNFNFSEEEIKQWISAGTKLDDYKFVSWFRGTKNLGSEWITNYKEDYQTLRDRFKKYDLCPECQQPNTGEQWCQDCNTPRIQNDFNKWTSHNPQIDQFIKKYQLAATDADKFIEWIPYEQFTDIEYLAEGGFGKVYRAKWPAGNIHYWDNKKKQWYRKKDYYYEEEEKEQKNYVYYDSSEDDYFTEDETPEDAVFMTKQNKKYKDYREVALKSLTNSNNNTNFLQETEKHKIIDDWFNNIVSCYGLSQDPETGNYLMIMQYMPEGNLRQYLSKNNRELNLKDKLIQLINIAQGLKDIHQKNLVHRDFHSGNILKGIERTSCLITDLGLCKPANETNQEDKIYGVLPYVAPEVLQNKPYTQASDIYSFGIIAYEMLSGLPPYYDRAHDPALGARICVGLRPKFQIKIPQLLEDLIKICWDTDPAKRPTANELEEILRKLQGEISNQYRRRYITGFIRQFRAAEEYNKTLPDEVRFPKYEIHKGAVYTSRILPTKEITRLLQSSPAISEQFHTAAQSLSISITNLNLQDTSKATSARTEPEQQTQVQQTSSPKPWNNN